MQKSIKVTLVLTVATALCSLILGYTYEHTKESYTKVGFNDGRIYANTEILEKVRGLAGPLRRCSEFTDDIKISKLIEVKADVVYVSESHDGSYKFCE